MKRIAIVGGGVSGLAAAYELARQAEAGADVEAVLFEAAGRFGGVIETVREGGFTIEGGPDAWVTAKPWARELAVELGLESELIASNDHMRKTHIFLATKENLGGSLVAMPDGFHMMVPSELAALTESALFTAEAIAAYGAEPGRAAELLAAVPEGDESIAEFTLRHFGAEVLERVAAPLLSGVFGGDVDRLSVRAVMPAFVAMEREHGSLITAVARIAALQQNAKGKGEAVFTTLRSGLGALVGGLVGAIPPHWLRLNTAVTAIESSAGGSLHADSASTPSRWTVASRSGGQRATEDFDAVLLATPLDVTRRLLAGMDSRAAGLLPVEASSAVLVAFAYADAGRVPLPQGFGFLVPPSGSGGVASVGLADEVDGRAENFSSGRSSLLLACTFVDQKFEHRVPAGGRLVRAFFGGADAERISRCNNDEIATIARMELARILQADSAVSDPAPAPVPAVTVVRRWPNSLPQYAVGHLERVAELEARLRRGQPGLTVLGNALHGVGIPDLIRDGRAAAREVVRG
jgi:protoporphyrinogen/coproporphyrinogen III oxidase